MIFGKFQQQLSVPHIKDVIHVDDEQWFLFSSK